MKQMAGTCREAEEIQNTPNDIEEETSGAKKDGQISEKMVLQCLRRFPKDARYGLERQGNELKGVENESGRSASETIDLTKSYQ